MRTPSRRRSPVAAVVAATLLFCAGARGQAPEGALEEAAALLDSGDLHAARTRLEDLAVRLEDAPTERIRALYLLGVTLYELSAYDDAISVMETRLAEVGRLYGAAHEEAAVAHNDLGVALLALSRLEPARTHLEESLEIREQVYGPDSLPVAQACANLGQLVRVQGDIPYAISLMQRSLAIVEGSPEAGPVEVAGQLSNLAALQHEQADYAQARRSLERALELLEGEAVTAEWSATRELVLSNLAAVVDAQGDLARSITLNERVLATRTARLGPDHLGVAVNHHNLASAYQELGLLKPAVQHVERALAIRAEILGDRHPDVASSLVLLAGVFQDQGDTRRARPLLERALEIREQSLGPEHPDVAETLGSLAVLLRSQGDRTAALPLLRRCLAIREHARGPDHPSVANVLSTLGLLLSDEGDHTAARQALERSVRIREEALGIDHPAVARSLANLASALRRAGDTTRALEHQQRALTIRRTALGPDHPEVALTLMELARIHRERQETEAALETMRQAVDVARVALPDGHPHLAWYLSELARLLAATGDREAGRAHADRALAIHEAGLQLADGLSEREAISLLRSSRSVVDTWLGLFDGPADAAAAWTHVLRWKAAIGRRQRERARMLHDDEGVAALQTELASIRHDLARTIHDPRGAAAGLDLDQALRDKEALERKIAELSTSLRDAPPAGPATPAGLCAELPDGSGLVDLLWYRRDARHAYLAFVAVAPGCAVHRVELGEAAPLDAAVARWRRTLSRGLPPTAVEHRSAIEVSERLWAPLAPLLHDTSALVVVPDGRLASIPYAALPTEEGVLVSSRTLTLLADAQDLARTPAPPGAGALLLGDVDFGEPQPTNHGPCSAFAPLPGTVAEVEDLGNRWVRGRHREEPMLSLTGAEARERPVVEAMAGRRVIHLATHGFTGGLCGQAPGDAAMLLSGVVLAGANSRAGAGGGDDGILTAEELGSVDLRGTELLTLSACETALGEAASGEGVLGLQRAASIAGARHLLMSLWPVADAATARMMDEVYGGLLRRRRPLPPAEALRAAQLRLIADEAPTSAWAAFVVAGPP